MTEMIPVIIDGESTWITEDEFKKRMESLLLVCNRCGHSWIPRGNCAPKVCPNPDCKSPYWNKTRVRKVK